MPQIVNVGGEECQVFPECCRKERPNCYQCIVMEGKALCRYAAGAHLTTSGSYTISSVAVIASCSTRSVWNAVNCLGLPSRRERHHRILTDDECKRVVDYIHRDVAIVFDRDSQTVKVASSEMARRSGYTREWIDALVRRGIVSGFVSGCTYADVKAFDEHYGTDLYSYFQQVSYQAP